MGKKCFEELYKRCKAQVGGEITLKYSNFCDAYVEGKNYAGVVVYMVDGSAKWMNQ
eukprot:evm.model.scf_933.7 EVM.evm.TU.scf_933.7   scf_933:29208-29373(-)